MGLGALMKTVLSDLPRENGPNHAPHLVGDRFPNFAPAHQAQLDQDGAQLLSARPKLVGSVYEVRAGDTAPSNQELSEALGTLIRPREDDRAFPEVDALARQLPRDLEHATLLSPVERMQEVWQMISSQTSFHFWHLQ